MSQTTEALLPSDADTQAKIERARKIDAEIVELTRAAYDPSEKLGREVKLGRKFIERCRFQKDNTKDWNHRAYSAMCKAREEEVQLILGVNEVRMDVSAKVAMFVDAVKPGNESVEKVPHGRIANYFLPMLEWDGSKLEGTIKADWWDFIRTNIDDNARSGKDTKPAMAIAELRNLIDAEVKRQADHAATLKGAQPASTGPDDKTGKKLEAQAKAAQKRAETVARKARDEARDGITTAADNLEKLGGYNATDKAKVLAAAGVTCGIAMHSVETIDVESAGEFIKALYMAGKMAELNVLVTQGQAALTKLVDFAKARQAG